MRTNQISKRRGQGLTEYGLILVLVALASMMATDKVKTWVQDTYTGVSDKVTAVGQ